MFHCLEIINNKIKRYWYTVTSLIYILQLKKHGRGIRFSTVKEFYGGEFVSIGSNTCFSFDLYLTVWKSFETHQNGIVNKQLLNPHLVIGDNCNFGAYNHITCINRIIIGNGVLTGKWVTITDNNHGNSDMASLSLTPMNRILTSKGAVVIGDNVWIGDKATILSGVTIGTGAVVAANSVVAKDVPCYSVVAGIPAKVIKIIK